MVLLRGFATFSRASGLQMSPAKTSAYFNGVPGWLKADILEVARFTEGELPFRYLGIPITAGRLSKAQCQILVEKITSKIASFGTRHLSYSGRLVLVNAVLTSLYTYWMNVFVIPKNVVSRLNAICRNYLWDGTVDYMRVPNVSWDKSCSPKAEGGLGIKDSYALNSVVGGKLVWWIYCCPDKLWVKWVNQIYLKGKNLDDYTPTGDMSWGWKNVCRVKEKLSSGYCHGQWLLDLRGYSVSSGYELLRKKYTPVQWHKYIWHSWSVLKHRFIGWLITREALQVKEKLYALGISPDDLCLLCGREAESHHHLFHHCVYSRGILEGMARLCAVNIPTDDILMWIWQQHWSKIKKGILCCAAFITYGCSGIKLVMTVAL
ncbi:uncharacterized protein LOC141649384 [Silene latifolia]|uniref:uncharacterized protein LOC141649384 n=1 Tax=Silene latifolia TaxID=37657 RepID=UPI003D76FF42